MRTLFIPGVAIGCPIDRTGCPIIGCTVGLENVWGVAAAYADGRSEAICACCVYWCAGESGDSGDMGKVMEEDRPASNSAVATLGEKGDETSGEFGR